MFTDDPIADFYRHDAEQERLLARMPICHHCKNHIKQEKIICINGKYYCDECLEDYYTVDAEDFMN